MTKPTLTFVTSNPNKLKEVQQILGDSFIVVNNDTDLAEFQGSCAEEITRLKALEALKQGVPTPFIVEDTCLCFNAFGGLPGPYIKWFLQNIGPSGLHKMLAGFEDKTSFAQCTFAFVPSPDVEPILCVGKTAGEIVEPAGQTTFGWDPIFFVPEYKQTYAQMESSLKNSISHRGKALELLKQHLIQ
ncbi:hypothetical protein RCL1_007111 [Eukaryota sp. TZLM3-RCL]